MDVYGSISLELSEVGWCVRDEFVPVSIAEKLYAEISENYKQGRMRPAGVGRGSKYQRDMAIRSDWISWLDPCRCTDLQCFYLGELEKLRLAINRKMYLGILDLECHQSVYPPGASYEIHLDQFPGSGERLVTCILYLNGGWHDDDGGQLNVYLNRDDEESVVTIDPIAGRLVTFLSGRYMHSVSPTRKNRHSITGWFKSPMRIC
jgi:SM-20-related protein